MQCDSPFQTWVEALNSVGWKAEEKQSYTYRLKFLSAYLVVATCITDLYLKNLSYPGVIDPNELVPLLPKETKFNNSLDAALLMDSYILQCIECMICILCVQCEFFAFFWQCLPIFFPQHIWQLCAQENVWTVSHSI